MSLFAPDDYRQAIRDAMIMTSQSAGGGLFAPAFRGMSQVGGAIGYSLAPENKRQAKLEALVNTWHQKNPDSTMGTALPALFELMFKNGFEQEAMKLQQAYAQMQPEGITAKDISPISKEVTPIIDGAIKRREAAASLEKLEKSGSPTDMVAGVFKFMKALDPTSTVRETEQGQVYSAGGAMKEFAAYVNGLTGGGKLNKDLFKEVVLTSKRLANSEIESSEAALNNMIGGYRGTKIDKAGYLDKQLKRLPSMFEIEDSQKVKKRVVDW